jgi:phage shock protein A
MSLLTKLWTLFRGHASEAGERIVDANALTILDQEMRDAKTALSKAQTDLASLMGKRKLEETKFAQLSEAYQRDAALAQRSLAEGREDLAQELATRIARVESEALAVRKTIETFSATEERLKQAVESTRQRISAASREIETVRATESVQQAQASIASGASGVNSKLNSAMDSLNRMKEKQAARDAHFQAASELDEAVSGGALDKKLADAGLLAGASSGAGVLARLKAGQSLTLGASAPAPAALAAPQPLLALPSNTPVSV